MNPEEDLAGGEQEPQMEGAETGTHAGDQGFDL